MNMETGKKYRADEAALLDRVRGGDGEAVRELLAGVRDMIFNLSLRMSGGTYDAADCMQDIYVKILDGLPGFKGESSFSTWVYRIAVNYLLNRKKGMFASHSLNFDFYAQDIRGTQPADIPDTRSDAERELLFEELKQSCTNVMLQCLSPEDRCIFVFGTMFKVDSKTASDVLGISAEAYRARLSRVRKRMSSFLAEYCGHSGTGLCSCSRRIGYAIGQHRLDPGNPEYTRLKQSERERAEECQDAMEELDAVSSVFASRKAYCCPEEVAASLESLLDSREFSVLMKN